MNPIIWFTILGVSCLIVFIPQFIASRLNRENDTPKLEIEPFSATAYFDRMEKATLDILEKQEPVDKTIILWWGLGGLRLNEDGTLEWISRKKPKPVNQDIHYQMCQSIQSIPYGLQQARWTDQMQSAQARIDELRVQNVALQNQAKQYMQNAAIIGMLTPPMTPACQYYSPYMQPPYLQSALAFPLTQCCCNYGRLP